MSLLLHVHNDIEEAAKWFKIPLVMWHQEDVYIMQDDRCVFVGRPYLAERFLRENEGTECKTVFPLDSP